MTISTAKIPKQLHLDVVDAFAESQFSGNSAAVIILDAWLPEQLMQSIATENNLSETAFLVAIPDDTYEIRWFSPVTEIDFCGHATLASAYVLFKKQPEITRITLYAQAVGTLSINKLDSGLIEMDFPNRAPEVVADPPEQLLAGLSIKPSVVLKNTQAYFAVYDNSEDVISVVQDTSLIKQLNPLDVVVTAPVNKAQTTNDLSHYDFISRYFWPANGSDEDPVTGSIHTGLAPYWASILNKYKLTAYQASSRGGVLNCHVKADRVLISGNAQHYMSGTITIN